MKYFTFPSVTSNPIAHVIAKVDTLTGRISSLCGLEGDGKQAVFGPNPSGVCWECETASKAYAYVSVGWKGIGFSG